LASFTLIGQVLWRSLRGNPTGFSLTSLAGLASKRCLVFLTDSLALLATHSSRKVCIVTPPKIGTTKTKILMSSKDIELDYYGTKRYS
jgi:hypothetical protein